MDNLILHRLDLTTDRVRIKVLRFKRKKFQAVKLNLMIYVYKAGRFI